LKEGGAIGTAGSRAYVESKVAGELAVHKDLDLVFTRVPFFVRFAGEIDTALALFGRVTGGDHLGIRFDAGDGYSDEDHLDGNWFYRIELDDAIDRDVVREETGDCLAGLAVAVIFGKIDVLDAAPGGLRTHRDRA